MYCRLTLDHNAIHATDVLHCIQYFTLQSKLADVFTDIDLLAMYTGAAIHDVGHPGLNNHFLISTQHSLSTLYNDKSVLENHHCATAFGLLQDDANNFARDMDPTDYKILRTKIVDMVLATDLGQHFQLLTAFKTSVLEVDPDRKRYI